MNSVLLIVIALVASLYTVSSARSYVKAIVPDTNRYRLAPMGKGLNVLNREHCMSICNIADSCGGFLYSSTGECIPLKHSTKPEPLARTGTLYVKDLHSQDVDLCNRLMPLEDLSSYIMEEESCK